MYREAIDLSATVRSVGDGLVERRRWEVLVALSGDWSSSVNPENDVLFTSLETHAWYSFGLRACVNRLLGDGRYRAYMCRNCFSVGGREAIRKRL